MSKTNRKVGGEIVYNLHEYSIKLAFAQVKLEELKRIAQKLREQLDWSFDRDKKELYECVLEIIREYEPKFETEFVPAQ